MPHGHAGAMLLPGVFKLNADVQESDLNDSRGMDFIEARMADLYAMLNCDSSRAASEFLQQLILRIGLDGEWVGTLGVDIDEMRAALIRQVNLERMGNNPRKFSHADLECIASYIRTEAE